MGGNSKDVVIALQKQNVKLIPVTVNGFHIYKKDSMVDLSDPKFPNSWTNFYRSDDLAATAYFYLDSPENDLPAIQPMTIRTWKIYEK